MEIHNLVDRIRSQDTELSEDEKLQLICSEIFPPLTDDMNGSIYRSSVCRRFISLEGSLAKRDDEGRVFRTENESRLDRALTQTADAYDRSEATIRSLCIHNVYTGESQTRQFLEDVLTIEERYKAL